MQFDQRGIIYILVMHVAETERTFRWTSLHLNAIRIDNPESIIHRIKVYFW